MDTDSDRSEVLSSRARLSGGAPEEYRNIDRAKKYEHHRHPIRTDCYSPSASLVLSTSGIRHSIIILAQNQNDTAR